MTIPILPVRFYEIFVQSIRFIERTRRYTANALLFIDPRSEHFDNKSPHYPYSCTSQAGPSASRAARSMDPRLRACENALGGRKQSSFHRARILRLTIIPRATHPYTSIHIILFCAASAPFVFYHACKWGRELQSHLCRHLRPVDGYCSSIDR